MNRTKNLRLAAGLTQKQVAEQAQLSESTVSRFERGDPKYLTVGVALAICKVLGVKVEDLFFGSET